MDFGTMAKKVQAGSYASLEQFKVRAATHALNTQKCAEWESGVSAHTLPLACTFSPHFVDPYPGGRPPDLCQLQKVQQPADGVLQGGGEVAKVCRPPLCTRRVQAWCDARAPNGTVPAQTSLTHSIAALALNPSHPADAGTETDELVDVVAHTKSAPAGPAPTVVRPADWVHRTLQSHRRSCAHS